MSSVNRTPSSGGVRNLRAMFENKGSDPNSTSPPSRGRSPANSDVSAQSRPVSKVRASFVAVERPSDLGGQQQWGLRKYSDVSSMAEVKEEAMNEQKDTTKINGSNGANGATHEVETVNGHATTSENKAHPETTTELGSLLKGSAFESPEKSNSAKPPASQPPKSPSKPKSPQKEKHVQGSAPPAPAAKDTKQGDKKTPAKIDTGSKTIATELKRKPSKLSTSKPPVTSSSAPRTPKTPSTPGISKISVKGSPNKPAAVAESAARSPKVTSKTNELKPKSSRASLTTGTAASKAKTAPAIKASPPKRKENSSSDPSKKDGTITTGGFVKPKPKSPTRPARLPAAATALTAAAAAKTGAAAERSPSRAGISAKAESTSLARKPSTLKRDRPPPSATHSTLNKKTSRASLSTTHANAHPPQGKDRPKSRVSNAPEGSFLTRMMRPTASSAEKTHERPHEKPHDKERPKSRVSAATGGKASDDSFLARMMRPTASSAEKKHEKSDVPSSPPSRRVSGNAKPAVKPDGIDGSRRVPSLSKKTGNSVKKSLGKDTAAKEVQPKLEETLPEEQAHNEEPETKEEIQEVHTKENEPEATSGTDETSNLDTTTTAAPPASTEPEAPSGHLNDTDDKQHQTEEEQSINKSEAAPATADTEEKPSEVAPESKLEENSGENAQAGSAVPDDLFEAEIPETKGQVGQDEVAKDQEHSSENNHNVIQDRQDYEERIPEPVSPAPMAT